MDSQIIEFLTANKLATLCYLDVENKPMCFSCFFAFNPSENKLIIKTSENTLHSRALKENKKVSGTIHPNSLSKIATQGIQYRGEAFPLDDNVDDKNKQAYYLKFPMALAIKGTLWAIDLTEIKYTHKRMNIGNTILWHKP